MADVIFGGTVRFMTMFGMMKPTPEIAAYLEKINARPALKRTDEKIRARRSAVQPEAKLASAYVVNRPRI